MGKKGYKVAPEVKKEILRRIKEEGITVSKAAEEHGVTTSTIYNWLGSGIKNAPTWSEFSRLKKERDDLLRIVGELTVKLGMTQKKS